MKGLSFHPIRPWIITSLHSGALKLYDYRMGTLLDNFDEHDGPVRGVNFHKVQPLIVSGGDDYKVKVWDYKLRRCLFTLLGHLDYIRTVEFHHEYPWIVSASDDQTIRIWNWQSRSSVALLTGHNHYVMCASFHPREDLIVSASLDQTVRVWDTTGLCKKTVRGSNMGYNDMTPLVNNDFFGVTDAVVKYVLEGHERGVNWAAFHHTLPLIVSGADDRQVKLWRMNETKAWEVHSMTGHTNNVSCVLFHPRRELILSNSEDRSIRVWDMSQRLGVQTFRRENDRFWSLVAHSEQNVIAAGHDSGVIVFKLERERPAYTSTPEYLYYVSNGGRYIRSYNYASGKDIPVVTLRKATGASSVSPIGTAPCTLSYNAFGSAGGSKRSTFTFLTVSAIDGRSYELVTANGDWSGGDAQDIRRGSCLSAVFIAHNRFAVLDKNCLILIKNFQNEVTKKITLPNLNVSKIFPGGVAGRILLLSEDRVTLFDVQSRKILGEVQAIRARYVFWNKDSSLVALVSKQSLVICSKTLEQKCTVSEMVRIKCGAWEGSGGSRIFVYCTLNHIKYVVSNGDKGIISTLDVPLYIVRTSGMHLFCLDREVRTRILDIDIGEAKFKLALEDRRYGEVMHMVRHSRLCGQAIVSYLREKNFPEVALHFVTDAKSKFKIALACSNIQVALQIAEDIPDEAIWAELAHEAMRQGNHQVVEMAFQHMKNFEGLSFLYLITGSTERLQMMLKIARRRGDVMSSFHNTLYLGDVSERVQVLESAGQPCLAYITAATHGLEEEANRLRKTLEYAKLPIPDLPSNAVLLIPPTPIIRADNWPLLETRTTVLEEADYTGGEGEGGGYEPPHNEQEEELVADAWGGDLDLIREDHKQDMMNANDNVGAEDDGGWGDDLDLGDDDLDLNMGVKETGSAHYARQSSADDSINPQPGKPRDVGWCTSSSHASDHIAGGDIEGAMALLHRQIAVVNFAPLEENFMAVFTASTMSLPTLPSTPSIRSLLERNNVGPRCQDESLPLICLRLSFLIDNHLKVAYKAFHAGNFGNAKEQFMYILHAVPFCVAQSKSEGNELEELPQICREYVTAIRIKILIAETEDPARSMELSAYFTHCNLQPMHILLALRLAMALCFKNKNYITSAGMAQRLLELPDMTSERNADLRRKASKILQNSQQFARNESEINYDATKPFVLDCSELKPIYRGSPFVQCPYCKSRYSHEMDKKLCVTCNVSQIGYLR